MTKLLRFTIAAMTAAALFFTSCATQKKADTQSDTATRNTTGQTEFLRMVHAASDIKASHVTSKIKLNVEMGSQKISLTGNLRMYRNDVIRLQLMIFGLVEAGRFEFTKDEVLIIDRINKQYIKAPYRDIDFLRSSGINFYTLQALFWNQLFIPGMENLGKDDLNKFTTDMGSDEAVISLERGKINYNWLASQKTGRINTTNIMYRDSDEGQSQLNWNYKEYGSLNGQSFPNDMAVTLTTPKKEVKVSMKLSNMDTDSQWETRSTVSDKYREVTAEELLKRILTSF